MRLSEFKKWVRQKLGQDGDCGVIVELTDNQIEQALEDAKDWFHSYFGFYKEAQLSLSSGVAEYDLSAISPAVDEVVQVWFPKDPQYVDFSVLYPGFLDISGFPYEWVGMFRGSYPQTTLVQTMQTIESTARILSCDLSWEYWQDRSTVPVTKLLRVMPVPQISGPAIYQYRVDPADMKIDWYSPRNLWILREWALAECKYTLGRIRGKYTGGLPAAGGDRTLDGESLISEAQADKERLQTQILDIQGPVMPSVG